VSPADRSKEASHLLDLQAQLRSLALGVRFLATAFAVVTGFSNFRLAFQIGIFHRMYQESLPGLPLPLMTDFIIRFQTLWILVSLVLPIASVIVAWAVSDHRKALIWILVLTVAISMQENIAYMSLFSPLGRLTVGMSPSS
jgi:hypothetical protein